MKSVAIIKDSLVKVKYSVIVNEDPVFNVENPMVDKEDHGRYHTKSNVN